MKPIGDAWLFVGRDRELAALTERLDALGSGRGSVVLFAGEPGIGKTRLAEEVAAAASTRGAQVLWGRAFDGEGTPAFWPWIQVVRSFVRDADEGSVRALWAGLNAGLAPLARMVPDLRRLLPSHGQPAVDPMQGDERFQALDGLTMFLKRAAETCPLVVIVDDLHWADPSSLLMTQFLAREVADAPLLLLATYRDEEARRGRPLTRTLAEIVRTPDVLRLVLDGLGKADVARLIESLTGAQPPALVVSAIVDETEGNPLFVGELARLLATEDSPTAMSARPVWTHSVPRTVREVIGARVDRLSAVCTRLLTLAAVIGREFDLPVLGRVARIEPDLPQDDGSLLETLAEAEEARIIAPAGTPSHYHFSHALLRDTIYLDLPSTRRPALHRRVGLAIEEMPAAQGGERLVELAYHFVQAAPAGESAKGAAYSRRAGDHALIAFSYEEAARHYEQALSLAGAEPEERFDLLLALADAHLKAGDREAGRSATERAATIARTLGDPHRLARAALIYGGLSWSSGTVDDARIRLFEEAASALTHDDALRARVLAGLVYALYWTGDQARMSILSEQALSLARQSGDRTALADALVARHSDRWAPEHAEERQSIATEMIHLASIAGRTDLEMQGRLWLIRDLAEQAKLTEAIAQLDRFEQRASDVRQPLFLWRAAACRAALALLRGQFDGAERLMQQALAIGRRAPESGAAIHYAAQIFALRAEQGRLDEPLPADWSDTSFHAAAPALRAGRIFQYFECGHLEEARSELAHLAADDFAALRVDPLNWSAAVSYIAPVCAALGDRTQIESLYRQMQPHARRVVCGSVFATAHGSMARYLGILAAALGRWREAEAHFDLALTTNERLGALPQIAATRLAYAEMLIARGGSGDAARATALLAAALDTARQLGMARVVQRIVRIAGDTPPIVEPTGASGVPRPVSGVPPPLPDPLTPREVEVLRLVASGRTSTQIAAELVLSAGTVRKHIANIYAKIDVHGKAEATAYALRHGLL